MGWSFHQVGPSPGDVLGPEGLRQMGRFAARLFPPDLSGPVVADALVGAGETLAIALSGTVLALAVGAPLAVLGTRTLQFEGVLFERESPGWRRLPRLGIFALARLTLSLLRTVPEIVWALIAVFAVGLGPFPGVLALGLHTGGVLGKLFAEVLEEVPAAPLESLQASGASRPAVLLYGVLPQALPQCLAYALYRWEVNIRAAAVLGFVGAGGLGQRIHIALSLFLERELLTLLLVTYGMVTLVDALSGWLRRRLV